MDDFEYIKENAENYYKSIKPIYCPYLRDTVYFNVQGISHLKFKKRGTARTTNDQYMRFKLLHIVPLILSSSHTLQGILETKKFEYIKVNNRWENILKYVTYYEFIAVIKRNRVKIIVKQIENNQKFFWSIIPFWNTNKKSLKRILHNGIPEED